MATTAGRTWWPPFRTRDTVPRETPANWATSSMVGRCTCNPRLPLAVGLSCRPSGAPGRSAGMAMPANPEGPTIGRGWLGWPDESRPDSRGRPDAAQQALPDRRRGDVPSRARVIRSAPSGKYVGAVTSECLTPLLRCQAVGLGALPTGRPATAAAPLHVRLASTNFGPTKSGTSKRGGNKMKVKKLLALGATTATLLGVLAGTAVTASASSKVTLTWWTWTTNPQKVIANFEKAYPDITDQTASRLRLGRHFLPQAHHRPGRRHRA